MRKLSIYIHIPFCDHKCIYCDFYSVVTLSKKANYLTALKREIEYYAERYSSGREVVSIYFGGGTPSYLAPDEIRGIIESVKEKFNLATDVEITLETNPGTVDKIKINEFKGTGINRISVGVQSFDDEELKFLTRIHNGAQALETVENIYSSGIENVSIDLIFNLPGQTKRKWEDNLRKAVSLPIKHISPYSLILERGTILNKMVLDGKVKLRESDYDADLYELTIEYLNSNGFAQYEVSNFAKRNYKCVHNLSYWRYGDYLGFGTSSHSFAEGKRWWNYSALTFYLRAIGEFSHARAGEEKLSSAEMTSEFVMLSLRSEGLDLSELEKKFGQNWYFLNQKYIEELIAAGFIEYQGDNFIKFAPKGYAVCDEILTKFK